MLFVNISGGCCSRSIQQIPSGSVNCPQHPRFFFNSWRFSLTVIPKGKYSWYPRTPLFEPPFRKILCTRKNFLSQTLSFADFIHWVHRRNDGRQSNPGPRWVIFQKIFSGNLNFPLRSKIFTREGAKISAFKKLIFPDSDRLLGWWLVAGGKSGYRAGGKRVDDGRLWSS